MLVEFFLDHAKFEFSTEHLNYTGYVPDLPNVHVQGSSIEDCRAKLAQTIADLLAREATAERVSNLGDAQTKQPAFSPEPALPPSLATPGVAPKAAAAHSFSDIVYEKKDWVARVTINRPEVYNVYSSTTLREMAEAFRDAASDEKVAVLVLTGAGDHAFCTGSDLKEHTEEHLGRPQQYWEWMGLLIEAHDALRHLGKPSIARINGIVAGGGNEWNLACDLAVAADHAKFMHVETAVGMVAACGATQWLPLVI
jgi:hypothetical protein